MIDSAIKTPKYMQIADSLLQRIQGMQPGERLMSENELARRFSVHRLTARQAMNHLVNQGLAYRVQGKGAFVANINPRTRLSSIGCLFRPIRGRQDDDNYFLEIFEGVSHALSQAGCSMLFERITYQRRKDRAAARRILENNVDAILLDERLDDEFVESISFAGVPLVVVNRCCDIPETGCVFPDNQGAMRQIMRHLNQLGHERLLFIHDTGLNNQAERLEAFRHECKDLGIPAKNIMTIPTCEKATDGRVYFDATIRGCKQHSPTAIITAFDHIAPFAYQALQHLGLRIGDDVSIVSVGDYRLAANLEPPLTTCRIATEQIGREAVRLARGGRNIVPKSISVKTSLIVRDSCARVGSRKWR